MLVIVIVLNGGNVIGQLDERFGAGGVEGTNYLGHKGLKWYRDWQNSYLPENYPQPGKNKFWTVGKIDYRTDDLGMDWRWIVLDLLEDTDVDLLQHFLNLCLAIVDKNILPIFDDYWTINKPLLETELENTLNNFVYQDMKYRVKYRAKCKNTDIYFQDELPEFDLTVTGEAININTSLSIDWTTHIYLEAWVLNPNPFRWGYIWKDIGDADCDFQTTINISGEIGIEGLGRDRHLQVTTITTNSKTKSDIDWSLLGIDFTWNELSNSVEDLIDDELEKTLDDELNKEPITTPYYFVDYFKDLFPGGIVPTQQEILDRIFDEEKEYLATIIVDEGYKGEYWAVGNEPNWSPLFEPEQYAEYYIKYYRLIKELDPNAKMIGPSIFLTEAIENPGDVAFLLIPDIFQGLLAGIKEEFVNLINSYFQKADSKTWYSRFVNHLPDDVKVDLNDFHIYPISADLQTIDWDRIISLMDEMAGFMQNVTQVEDVWITEFGNRDWRYSESEVADLCSNFCQYLKSNSVGIKKWFWFLSRGHTPFFDIPNTPDPPITALLNDDLTLNQIGKVYLFAADCTPPIMASAPTDRGEYTSPQKIIFQWKEAKEYDTGITDYQVQVKAEPGDTTVYNAWVGNNLLCLMSCYMDRTLYARVQAKNGAGLIGDWSEWSDGITIRPKEISELTAYNIPENLELEKDLNQNILHEEHSENNEQLTPETNRSNRDSKIEDTEILFTNVPNSYELSQNYPNPFNSNTNINYQLPEDSHVTIKIYNTLGQEIKTLVNEYKTTAYYTVQWDGRDFNGNLVVSGIYVYRIEAGNYSATKKLAVLK